MKIAIIMQIALLLLLVNIVENLSWKLFALDAMRAYSDTIIIRYLTNRDWLRIKAYLYREEAQ